MPTQISTIETLVRQRLDEISPRYWASDELVGIIGAGVRDLWRDIANLKQEHFLTVNTTDVTMPADSYELAGVPNDVHKVHLIEVRDLTSSSNGLVFQPLDYNHKDFALARSRGSISPEADTIFYAITAPGSPVGAPVIRVAPSVSSTVNLRFSYVPTLGTLTAGSVVPIPGEADNALVAWSVAYARAKEREDRAPDPAWIKIYATEKDNLLNSLGLRQYHEPSYADALFSEYW